MVRPMGTVVDSPLHARYKAKASSLVGKLVRQSQCL
jgi:hypothetical protein